MEIREPDSTDSHAVCRKLEFNPYNDSITGKAEPPPAKVYKANDANKEQGLEPSVELMDKELWLSFSLAGNEMIVTKPGRRMFPTVAVMLSDLMPNTLYAVSLRFVLADDYRHKFVNGCWELTGKSEIIHDESKMVFQHPSSPTTGEIWMKKPISFKAIKITHFPKSAHGNILLHTMHKYKTELVITPLDIPAPPVVFQLQNTSFIAVTSYQSGLVTKLKVTHNPFAKGFRDRESCFETTLPLTATNYYPYPAILPPQFNYPYISPWPHLSHLPSPSAATSLPPPPHIQGPGVHSQIVPVSSSPSLPLSPLSLTGSNRSPSDDQKLEVINGIPSQ